MSHRGLLVAAALWATGCAVRPPPLVSPADVTWAQGRWPEVTDAELARGRELLLSECADCHRPPHPDEHAAEDWPGEVAEMAERAGLTPVTQRQIEQYVVTMARRR